MALLIDGYNLLHASGILPRGIGPGTLERARGALLNFLVESLQPDELARTVVVFDARAAPVGRPRTVTHRGLKVHFAPNPGDADALIEQLILQDSSPRRLTVVSSDHRLQRAAKRRRAQPSTATAGTPRSFAAGWGVARRRPTSRPNRPARCRVAKSPAGSSNSAWSRPIPASGETAQGTPAEPVAEDEPDSPGEKPPRGKSLRNPFPPGYGEDLLEEE